MIRPRHVQRRFFALILCALFLSSTPAALGQGGFRAEIAGSHLPTFGNAYDSLADGTPGQLSVVALARPTGESKTIAFVVRNNTTDLLVPWVTATALVEATGDTLEGRAFNPNAFPFIVEPGNLVIGEIAFEYPVPADATLDVLVTGEPPHPRIVLQDDLGPLWLDAFDATTGTGVVRNAGMTAPVFLDNFWRRMACFEDGHLQRLVIIDIDARSLQAQGTASFRLMQTAPGECDSFIFAGYGTQCALNRNNQPVCGPDRR